MINRPPRTDNMVKNPKKDQGFDRYFKEIAAITLTPGVALGYTEMVINLTDTLAAIGNVLGETIKVRSIRLHCHVEGANKHWIQYLFVQSAGTWSTTNNSSYRTIQTILDAAMNDDFAFTITVNGKVNKYSYGPTEDNYWVTSNVITVPPNILQILNRDLGTELSQDVMFGLVGVSPTNTAVTLYCYVEVDYTKVFTVPRLR